MTNCAYGNIQPLGFPALYPFLLMNSLVMIMVSQMTLALLQAILGSQVKRWFWIAVRRITWSFFLTLWCQVRQSLWVSHAQGVLFYPNCLKQMVRMKSCFLEHFSMNCLTSLFKEKVSMFFILIHNASSFITSIRPNVVLKTANIFRHTKAFYLTLWCQVRQSLWVSHAQGVLFYPNCLKQMVRMKSCFLEHFSMNCLTSLFKEKVSMFFILIHNASSFITSIRPNVVLKTANIFRHTKAFYLTLFRV